MAKKRKNSRAKGKRGERALLDPLTKWWGYKFHRTPSSGAWGTQHGRDDMAQDIVCDDPNFPFDIECKNAEGWHLEKLLTAPKNDIYQWWAQAASQCAPNKRPMLCFKRNRHPFLVITRNEDTPDDAQDYGPVFTLWPILDEDALETEVLDIYTLDQLTSCNITQWQDKDE